MSDPTLEVQKSSELVFNDPKPSAEALREYLAGPMPETSEELAMLIEMALVKSFARILDSEARSAFIPTGMPPRRCPG